MRACVSIGIFVAYLTVCSGCASNPDMAGQVISGVLTGIGAGLSGL